jgi:hypothetical protein
VILFGPTHLAPLLTIALASGALSWLCRRNPRRARTVRLAAGWGLIVNELVWWTFR